MHGLDLPPIAALRTTPDEARLQPNDPGHPSARVLAHGSMELRWFVPDSRHQHLPHDRDELYMVVSGSATFIRANEAGPFEEGALGVLGEERVAVQPGDVLFVPAGTAHRFDVLSADFAVWAVFYGPEGGERP